jgi:periplasmic protein TonB
MAIPFPEPPKPEPPTQETRATAPPRAKTLPSSVVRWESLLTAHIEHFKRYPSAARAHGDQGVVKVAFAIDREGLSMMDRKQKIE